MKTITIELTDAEYEIIENARQFHFDISCADLPEGAEIDPTTMDEYIKRSLIACAISSLQEVELNPEVWFATEPIKEELCEKYSLSEAYQKE